MRTRRSVSKTALADAAVRVDRSAGTTIVTIDRPARRNAVDAATALALYDAFRAFDADDASSVAVLTGTGGTFCAGADLRAIADGEVRSVVPAGDAAPMGPTRLLLSKPVVAAIEGYAVAGGLELALWCDLRVAASSAMLGVLNRRFGVPLVDLGTIRLPRTIGHGRALDLILTGRAVGAAEALAMGLVDRVVDDGRALAAALELAAMIASFPQTALRGDRRSAYEQWGLSDADAIRNEVEHGLATIASGESARGATRFAEGVGRGGA